MARTFGFFWAPSSRACTELGKQKGNMRRKALHRLWTLILMSLLCGAALTPSTRVARAYTAPTDPVPDAPPGTGPTSGDPDGPDQKQMPKPGAGRGVGGRSGGVTAPQQSGWDMWMLRLRMAFGFVYRFLFRF